jgi:hypothetical protein
MMLGEIKMSTQVHVIGVSIQTATYMISKTMGS